MFGIQALAVIESPSLPVSAWIHCFGYFVGKRDQVVVDGLHGLAFKLLEAFQNEISATLNLTMNQVVIAQWLARRLAIGEVPGSRERIINF